MTVVVDASPALKWVIEEDGTDHKRQECCFWSSRWLRRIC